MIDTSNNLAALDMLYRSMSNEISNMANQAILSNAAEYTGITASQQSLRDSLAENQSKQNDLDQGTEIVDAGRQTVGQIEDKVSEIRTLAADAASGDFTPQEVADMQSRYETLAQEITTLARGEIGEVHLLDENGTYDIQIGDDIKVSINTSDLTAEGLSIADLDLTADAQAAVEAADAAAEEITGYSEHLAGKNESLEAIDVSLDIQNSSLSLAQSYLDSVESAFSTISFLNSAFASDAQMAFIAQANLASSTVLSLLDA